MSILSDIKNVLESIGSNITTFTKALPVQKVLADLTVYLTQSEAYVQDYFPLVEQYDFYRYVQEIKAGVKCCEYFVFRFCQGHYTINDKYSETKML